MPRLSNAGWERFCRQYIKDLNGKQAYIRAGYSKNGAESSSSTLLTNPKVKARIAELQAPIEAKIEDDATRIREDLRLMSRVEVTDIYNDDRSVKLFSEMSKGARLLIAGLDIREEMLGGIKIADIVKLKTESKLKAIELLGKHFAVSAWEENVNLHDADSRVERMRRYQARKGKRGKKNPLREKD